MYWADKTAEGIRSRFKDKIAAGETLVVRDEKTVSGRVHIGSMRGVAVHGILSDVLAEKGVKNRFLYEINDFDPMDGIPVYLDKVAYEEHMGRPLCDIPSPDGKAASFAEYFAEDFIGVIEESGFKPEFYRSSEAYRAGKYNEVIKLALDNAQEIRDIYKEVSGSVKGADWYPINIVCEGCGKISTTKVLSWDGNEAEYECRDIEWAKGCGQSGKVAPFDGKAKLPWKVEWAAKFRVFGVDVEGAGKDHSTKGGSRDVAANIARRVFAHEPPFDVPYEFILVGGRKMSSSKGQGSSAREIADLLPPHMLRLMLLWKDIKQQINFEPEGDTIPVLYDAYDRIAAAHWEGKGDDSARLFELVHEDDAGGLEKRALPRFSTVAYLVQMPHVDMVSEFEKLDGREYSARDREELELRAKYARIWLDEYAPDDFKFEIQETMPDAARSLSIEQKAALAKVLGFARSKDAIDGQEFHTALHDIKKETGLEPKLFFEALYLSILGKSSGPKAGWFLSVLDRNFLLKRLEEASS